MTDADRHARATALFHDALDQPADRRAAWLREACGDDALRADVAALLRAHDEATGILDHPLFERDPEDDAEDRARGQRIGPWQIEERLGTGGMGVVYRAVRADGLYERTVALKLLAPGAVLASGEPLARRLAAERRILARLEHDGIARLYDGGVTDDGLPYLAVELIDGEPITAYADARDLGVPERIALFARACDAVAYAHRSLVVHRDLKPAHVLVVEGKAGDAPAVKLLDFGISALLGDPDENGLTLPTVPRALTPSYAAPEQVRGEPVTTATDVYALGVILYELLAGQRPYDLTGKTAGDIERIVGEIEPPVPSAVAGAPQRALRGDLDTIVMKALAKESERRYASAEALADDLRRYLRGLPVEARPATTGYRIGRFVRRHRMGVATTAAVVLLAIALTRFYTTRLANERDRTRDALSRSEQTLAFLRQMIVAGGAEEGDPDTPIGVVLDSAAVRAAELHDVPAVARVIHVTLGGVFHDLGRMEAAEREARRALDLFPESERDADYGRALHVLGMARAGQDDLDGAVTYHEQALRFLPSPASPTASPLLAEYRAAALSSYGDALSELEERAADTEAAYRESIALYQSVGDPDAAIPLNGLALTYNTAGRQEEAAPLLREVVETIRQQFDRPHYRLGIALSNLGATLNDMARYDEAGPVLHEAVDVIDQAVGPEHPNAVVTRATYALHLRAAGDVAGAVRESEATLDAAMRAFGPDHSLTAFAQNVAGQALCEGGDAERGADLLRASLATRRNVLPEGHWLVPNGESLLGECLARLGRNREAEALLASSYDALRMGLGPEHVRTVAARERLERVQRGAGATVSR